MYRITCDLEPAPPLPTGLAPVRVQGPCARMLRDLQLSHPVPPSSVMTVADDILLGVFVEIPLAKWKGIERVE